jgi:predicted O-linked N-acetylglucosamine transferase (SPINDLY family)
MRPTDSQKQQAMNEALEHQRSGRLDDAEDIYRRILSYSPDDAGILNNLANILKDSGRIEEAVEVCRKAVSLQPENAEIHSSLCYKLLFHPDYDRAGVFREQRQWNQRHGRRSRPARDRASNSNDRVRIGYVSPDFYGHAECFFVIPLLQSHDREQFEVHCYSSALNPDKATDLIRASADVWHDVRHLTDGQLAAQISRDHIDILVDLTMHMAFNRLLMFAQKPAPVQVTWLAYPGGTGLDAIDYRLTDAWIDPPGESDAFYSERSLRLPDSWCCYHPLGDVPPAAPRDSGPMTFGCLNNPCKLNRPTLAVWAKVLSSVADSRLMLLSESERQRRQIAEMFSGFGIDPGRIEFTARRRRGEYLRVYDRIDVCLDPLIYNGITTTCDAIWMGVPVVTLIGLTAPGRAGLSILSNLNLPELIAHDDTQFVNITTELAADFPRRSQLRVSLRNRMRQSPLMDAPRFARNVEAAYRSFFPGNGTAKTPRAPRGKMPGG